MYKTEMLLGTFISHRKVRLFFFFLIKNIYAFLPQLLDGACGCNIIMFKWLFFPKRKQL